jgi:putative membrane protein
MMIFWSILLIVVAVVLLRLVPSLEPKGEERDTPLERLQRRYAAGDLTTEEYEERKHRL